MAPRRRTDVFAGFITRLQLRQTRKAIEALGGKLGRRVLKKAMTAATTPVAKALRKQVPRGDTGALRGGISKKVWSKNTAGRFVGVVGARNLRKGTVKQRLRAAGKFGKSNPINYFHLVDQGARPHKIKSRNKKALAFIRADGVTIVRPAVSHPGAPAQNVVDKAFRVSKPESLKAFINKAKAELAAEYLKQTVAARSGSELSIVRL